MKKFLVLMVLVSLLAACGTGGTKDSSNNGNTNVDESQGDQLIDESNDEVAEEPAQVTDEEKVDMIREEASYVGQIDSNSIEVNTEMETIALQINKVQDVNWDEIAENAHVIVEYYKNDDNQNILQSIEVK